MKKVVSIVLIIMSIFLIGMLMLGCSTDIEDSEEKVSEEEIVQDETSEPEEPVEQESIELNSLQSLFTSITPSMTREDVDKYIEDNQFEKYAYTHDSGYLIGYESSAVRQRSRDRIGEMVEIDFYTSGDPDKLGTVEAAEYAVYTENSSSYGPKYEEGTFYLDGEAYTSGEAAMQSFLKDLSEKLND